MSNLLDSGNRYGPIADISASRKSVAKIMVLAQPWMIDSGLLTPIMKDLLSYGRVNRPARPWLGMYATESDDSIMVGGLADNGPAEQAGVRTGDRILTVGGEEISDLAGLWRRVWAAGSAGAEVRLRLMRDKTPVALTVRSADRTSHLKAPKLH